MEWTPDLYAAPKDELWAVIRRQQAVIEEQRRVIVAFQDLIATERAAHAETRRTLQAQIDTLTARVRTLEGRLGQGDPPTGMPGTKPTTPTPRTEPHPRKQRLLAFVRPRSTPTTVVEHALAACPDCGTPLVGGSVKRTREVIELPEAPMVITEHRFLERCCPTCERRHTPRQAVLAGLVVGQQRFGVRLRSLLVTLREELRLPVAAIRRLLALQYGLSVSVGSIIAATTRVAQHGAAAIERLTDQVRASPAIHADETGWRENGRNRYVWLFTSATAAIFRLGSRAGAMVDAVLGTAPSGVLVSDFYAGYHHYAGRQQKCWAHLLREIHELTVRFPQEVALQRWAAAVHALYLEAKAFSHPSERQRILARCEFERRLAERCLPFVEVDAPGSTPAPQAGLCRRMLRHLEELFVFVECPEVPATNNAAERGLRHLVTARKISGGTRSPAGSATKMTLASLFGSWRLQGRNPLEACQQLLRSPLP